MSTTEKRWALKSSNLKRIKNNSKNGEYSKSGFRNAITNRSNSPAYNLGNHTDIRKSSYPILPNPHYSNKFDNSNRVISNNYNQWESESNDVSDYEPDIQLSKAPQYQSQSVPSVIDNTFYRNYQNNNGRWEPQHLNNQKSKHYLMRQKPIVRTRSITTMNLNIFHAIQLVSLDIIDESLEEEIVPDVLIEVFREFQFKEQYLYKQIVPIVRSTAEQIMIEVIDEYIQETVLVFVIRDSKSLLKSQMIFKWVLEDLLQPILVDISKEAVHEVAMKNLANLRSFRIYEDIVTKFIEEDLKNSELDLYKEVIFEFLIEECVVDPVIEETLVDISRNMISYYQEKVSRINLQQVNEMAVGKPLGSLIFDHLVSVAARQKLVYGPSLTAQYCFEYFVFDILIEKTYDVYDKLVNTVESQPLRQWHKSINQSIITDTLIAKLFEHADADLCDLDAEEVEEPHIPRYLNEINQIFYQKKK